MFKLRPHHFLCMLGFRGKGYSASFVENFTLLKNSLHDGVEVEVASGLDSVCEACPHQRGSVCQSQPKVDALDRAHASVLGLRPGMILRWIEAKELLATRMDLQHFHRACTACSWKDLGYCQAALLELREGEE